MLFQPLLKTSGCGQRRVNDRVEEESLGRTQTGFEVVINLLVGVASISNGLGDAVSQQVGSPEVCGSRGWYPFMTVTRHGKARWSWGAIVEQRQELMCGEGSKSAFAAVILGLGSAWMRGWGWARGTEAVTSGQKGFVSCSPTCCASRGVALVESSFQLRQSLMAAGKRESAAVTQIN